MAIAKKSQRGELELTALTFRTLALFTRNPRLGIDLEFDHPEKVQALYE